MGRKLLTAAVNVLCVAAIAFSLLAGWTVISTPRGETPKLLGFSLLTVLTGSMAPTLPENCLIVVRETDPAEIAAGDIITFYADLGGRRLVNTHRVTEVIREEGGLSFRTQGDANPAADPVPVAASDLVGRVLWSSAALGAAVSLLRTPWVFFAVVAIPLLIIIISSIRHIVRLGREEVDRAVRELEEETDEDRG